MLKSRQVEFVSLSEVETNSSCLDGVWFIQLAFCYSVYLFWEVRLKIFQVFSPEYFLRMDTSHYYSPGTVLGHMQFTVVWQCFIRYYINITAKWGCFIFTVLSYERKYCCTASPQAQFNRVLSVLTYSIKLSFQNLHSQLFSQSVWDFPRTKSLL